MELPPIAIIAILTFYVIFLFIGYKLKLLSSEDDFKIEEKKDDIAR